MKNLFLTLIALGLSAFLYSQIIIDSELNIDNEVLIWNGEVRIQENVNVLENGKLIIEAGSTILFENHRRIFILGELEVTGEDQSPVLFSVMDTAGFYDLTTLNGGWGGIVFESQSSNSSKKSFIKNSIIKFVKGIQGADRVDVIAADRYGELKMENVQIIQNKILSQGSILSIRDVANFEFKYCFLNGNILINPLVDLFAHPFLTLNENLSYKIIGNVFYKNQIGTSIVRFNINRHSSYIKFDKNLIINNSKNFTLNESPFVTTRVFQNASSYNTYITNNIISNNYADVFYFSIGACINLNINNNTVVGNSGRSFDVKRDIIIKNNITYKNRQNANASINSDISVNSLDPPILEYNIIEEFWEYNALNINSEPLFEESIQCFDIDCDAFEFNWSLAENSPGVNMGTPDTTELGIGETDFYGNPRVKGGRVDIGAVEFQHPVSLSDIEKSILNPVLYPNPTADYVNILLPESIKNVQYEIIDLNGRILESGNIISGGIFILSIEKLPSDLYFVRLIENGKFLKKLPLVKI